MVIDLLFSEKLILFGFARGHLQCPELCLRAGRADLHPRTVEVVAVGDLPDQLHVVGAVRKCAESEGFVHREEVIAAGFLAALEYRIDGTGRNRGGGGARGRRVRGEAPCANPAPSTRRVAKRNPIEICLVMMSILGKAIRSRGMRNLPRNKASIGNRMISGTWDEMSDPGRICGLLPPKTGDSGVYGDICGSWGVPAGTRKGAKGVRRIFKKVPARLEIGRSPPIISSHAGGVLIACLALAQRTLNSNCSLKELHHEDSSSS